MLSPCGRCETGSGWRVRVGHDGGCGGDEERHAEAGRGHYGRPPPRPLCFLLSVSSSVSPPPLCSCTGHALDAQTDWSADCAPGWKVLHKRPTTPGRGSGKESSWAQPGAEDGDRASTPTARLGARAAPHRPASCPTQYAHGRQIQRTKGDDRSGRASGEPRGELLLPSGSGEEELTSSQIHSPSCNLASLVPSHS